LIRICLSYIFEKPEDEKRQHLKALFLKGFVNGKPVTRMLVDGGGAVNLVPYTMLRKIGKSEEDLTQTDMMLVDFEGNVSPVQGEKSVWSSPSAVRPLQPLYLSLKGGELIIYCWVGTGYMPIVAYHLQCINASSMDRRFIRGGTRRNLFDSSSYRSTRVDL
jgi:hypothetical protein